MLRRKFLKTAAVLAAARAAPARRPNLLFLQAAGWRAQTSAAGGDFEVRAPNLEQLAAQSIHFDRLYVSCPIEGPSQAASLTGRFPFACGVTGNGMRLPQDQPSIARELKSAGYHTGFIGAWYLNGAEKRGQTAQPPRAYGFDDWAAEPPAATGAALDHQAGLALDFIKQNQRGPFYLFLSWSPPPKHPARIAASETLLLRPNVPESYTAEARTALAAYYAHCAALDASAGRLLRALEEQRIAGDTVVVFTASCGSMLGSQGLEGANLPYEEAARVPLILRDARLPAPGRRSDLLVSNVDLVPTLLALCRVEIPDAVQGHNLLPLLAGHGGNRPESVYSLGQIGEAGEWRMLVRGLDKLVVDRDLTVTHLYNLGTDPFELENLAHDAAQELKRDELTALLKDWMRRSGDGMDPSGLKKRTR